MNEDILSQIDNKRERLLISVKRTLTVLLYLTGISPLPFVISILAFYFHAESVLGHFPTYDNPDPKQLREYDSYNRIIEPSFLIWFFGLALWLAIVITYMILFKSKLKPLPLIVGVLAHVTAIAVIISEILNWYMD